MGGFDFARTNGVRKDSVQRTRRDQNEMEATARRSEDIGPVGHLNNNSGRVRKVQNFITYKHADNMELVGLFFLQVTSLFSG